MNADPAGLRRVVRGFALYDLVITLPFATPWTAEALLAVFRQVHGALALGGEPMPVFALQHLFFVTLFGVLAVLWALARVVQPTVFLAAADTVGRAVVATWMFLSVAQGASQVLLSFVVMEVVGMLAQAGVLLATRRERAAAPVTVR